MVINTVEKTEVNRYSKGDHSDSAAQEKSEGECEREVLSF